MNVRPNKICFRIECADPAACIKALSDAGIPIFSVQQISEWEIQLHVPGQWRTALENICEAKGYSLRIFYLPASVGASLLGRPVLFILAATLIGLTMLVNSRVLFVRTEGNQKVARRLILETVESAGVYFGASRREIRNEQVKNILLENIPQLQWACVNTSGCVATVTVLERSDESENAVTDGVGHIVASADGIITSVTATAGTAMCRVGQAVTEGQLLISGFTDCERVIRAEWAEGEVFAQTKHILEGIIPLEYTEKTEISAVRKKYSLILGKKRINFFQNSGISDAACDRMYAEYYLKLPGGFVLPAALAVETCMERNTVQRCLPSGEAQQLLQDYLREYLLSHTVAGQILFSETRCTNLDSALVLTADYVCNEMIGRRQKENGDRYG